MSWVTNLMLHVSSAEGSPVLDSDEGRRFFGDALSRGAVFHPNTPSELKSLVNSTLSSIRGGIGGYQSKMEQVNAFFAKRDQPELASIDPVWEGRGKALECSVYVGAYNRLELDDFVEHLRGIAWNAPQFIQLFVKDQEDVEFRLIRIAE
jgi:hypothetical protein